MKLISQKRKKSSAFDGRLFIATRNFTTVKVEIDNLKIYGYGIKGYILSMIEAAMRISNNTIPIEIIEKIVQYGKNCSKNQLFYCQALKKLSRFARETRCSQRGH
jgi:hypothetical protein